MAGDWIKIQHVTPDKPEIYQIASILGITPEDAFGRCVRIWIWADQQSLNGHALCVTFVTLDSISRHTGFGSALSKVGWLIDNGDGTVTFPNFARHNGETAKTRADAANRKKKSREKKAESVTEMSQKNCDESVTREEKSKPSSSLRSEDGKSAKKSPSFSPQKWLESKGVPKQTAADWIRLRKSKKLEPTLTALEGVEEEAKKSGFTMADVIACCAKNGWGGFKASWDHGLSGSSSGAPWFMSSSGIEAKAVELGIEKTAGEIFPNFKKRVYQSAGVTDEMVRREKIDSGQRV